MAPKGIGAFDDIGGKAAAGYGALAREKKGVGAFDDMGGSAAAGAGA